MIRRMRLAASCALLAALAACSATTGGVTRITYDPGGMIDAYAERVREMNRTGARVELAGRHASAGTMLLAARGACVHPSASFGFHAPNFFGLAVDDGTRERGIARLAAHYPPNLRRWFLATYARRQPGEIVLYRNFSGRELKAMDPRHITLCQ